MRNLARPPKAAALATCGATDTSQRLTVLGRATRAGIFCMLMAAPTACGGDGKNPVLPPTPPPTPPTPPTPIFSLTAVSPVVPGAQVRLTGTDFTKSLPANITLDGQTVNVTRVSDTEASFVAPTAFRACETDGRKVALTAGAVTVQATLDVPDTVALAAGQSQVLDAVQVACLKLPAADQDYVLSALNLEDYPFTVDPNAPAPVRALLNITTHTVAGGEPTGAFTASVPMVHRDVHYGWSDEPRGPFSSSPVPFDPTYATAKVGDVVRMVNWGAASRLTNSNPCTLNRTTAPYYSAQVVAVARDATNDLELVIAADLTHPSAPDHVSETGRNFWNTAATIAAPLLVPTMRAVFDREYQPLAGGGRRFFVIIGNTSGASGLSSDGGTGDLQSGCALASEMTTVVITPQTGNRTIVMMRDAANIIIHEYAHNADQVTAWRLTGHQRNAGSWFGEAFATTAEETAARIAIGQDVNASELALTNAHPGFLRTALVWGARPFLSPIRGGGSYELGASLLLYAREAIGDASIHAAGPHLYERMLRRNVSGGDRWELSSLATLLETTPNQLLDRWSQAHATDDLVSPAAAAAHNLPQIRSWNHGAVTMDSRDGTYRHTSRKVSRAANTRRTLGAQPANYAAAYFFAEGDVGISLTLEPPAPEAKFRLTRLR